LLAILLLGLLVFIFARNIGKISGISPLGENESPFNEQISPPKENKSSAATSENLRPLFHDGTLIVDKGTYLVNSTKLTLNGNLIVNGTGELVVKDSELIFLQDYNQQYRVVVTEDASLLMENVKLSTGSKWFNFYYDKRAKATLNNVFGDDCCTPWHGSSDNATFLIKNSMIGLTVNQNVNVIAENSSLFFELVLANVSGTYTLPQGFMERYDLEIVNNENAMIKISAKNSEFTDWGATLDKYTDITFRNSKMTIGINAGSDWSRPSPKVQVSGLKNKVYDDYPLEVDTNKLRLINTFVRDWYPQAWNGAQIEISNSDLADIANSGQDSTIIIRNSKASIATAREQVTYKFYDSAIEGDVIAHDDSKIYLYNTKVKGKMFETGNGMIFVNDERI